MLKLIRSFFSPPSLRLSLLVISGVVLLLSVSLAVMFFFSRQALRNEAKLYAQQTLEGTVKHVDNILLSVEQSMGNICSEMVSHLNQPERMEYYCRRLMACNPNVSGCAVCLKPNYYPGRELFMTYVHYRGGIRKPQGVSPLVVSNRFGKKPYTEYPWYSQPMTTGRAGWTDPLPQEEDEGVILSFCLPIVDQSGERVGVFVADLSVDKLSQQILTESNTTSKYSVLLGSNGSYIVHPHQKDRAGQTVFSQTGKEDNPTLRKIAESMMAGETGYHSFPLNGKNWYIFYKPFQQTNVANRSMEKLNWSIGIVYSESEIFGYYNSLLLSVLVISVLGLLLFFLFIRLISRHQMKDILELTRVTNRIAEGHYDEPMPDIKRKDEIGFLFRNFKLMKQSLAAHVNELNQLTSTLQNRREIIHEVYAKEQSVDRMKTAILHHVTNQMIAPSQEIERCVNTLHSNYHELSPTEIRYVVDTINKKSDTIIELMANVLDTANDETGKEVGHE